MIRRTGGFDCQCSCCKTSESDKKIIKIPSLAILQRRLPVKTLLWCETLVVNAISHLFLLWASKCHYCGVEKDFLEKKALDMLTLQDWSILF